MLKRIEIPEDLWKFVGHALDVLGCIKVEEITEIDYSKYYEPKIRWLLLGEDDWKNYCSGIELCDDYKDNNKRLAEQEDGLVHIFVRESMEREHTSEKFSELKKMIVERGFIGFDSVILMRENHAQEMYNQLDETFQKINQIKLPLTLDEIRFQVFIQELINIYKLQFRKYFVCQENNPCFVNSKLFSNTNNTKINLEAYFDIKNEHPCVIAAIIMDEYFKWKSISDKEFKLKFRIISKSGELLEIQLRRNIWNALIDKKSRILKNNAGDTLLEFNIGKIFKLDGQTIRVNLGFGLKTKKNLVGFNYLLFHPSVLNASNVQEVKNAWNWITNKICVSEESLELALKTCSLSMLLWTGQMDSMDFSIFSLFVNLFNLENRGINTDKKIVELRRKINGHLKKFGNLEGASWENIIHVQHLRNYLYTISSECLLARAAKSCGYFVKLEKNPDLIIAQKGFEVKRGKSANLSNAIESARKQKHDIIAIEVDSLSKKEIPHYGSPVYDVIWLKEGNLRDVLKTILQMKFDGETILLFNQKIDGLKARIILIREKI